ncbi:Uncharacterized protein APZ42_033345 [Daphnia magna]|uniref:Uncharacterized protein n=1 Tax=Daphnia magna TaxID=35525 RepID=A0A164L6E9_9CRUS|nr:Uncharacterized protein APZ42_033345 [Daphnia magna]
MIGRHTAANILAGYEHVLLDWEFPNNKVFMVKTDGGSNMVANTFLAVIPGWINTKDSVSDQEAGAVSVSPTLHLTYIMTSKWIRWWILNSQKTIPFGDSRQTWRNPQECVHKQGGVRVSHFLYKEHKHKNR